MVLIHSPVREDQNIGPVPVSSVHLHKEMLNGPLQICVFIVGDGNLLHLKAVYLHVLNFQDIGICENGVIHLQNLAVDWLFIQ